MRIDRVSFFAALGACNAAASPTTTTIEIPHQPPQSRDAGATIAATAEPPAIAIASDEEEPSDGSCGFVDPTTVKRGSGPCSDDQGSPAACSKSCAFLGTKCDGYRKNMKPRVAERAITCLAKLGAKGLCESTCAGYRCGDRALKEACPDPSADGPCLQITSKCKSVSLTECRLYLSGMNATGRAHVVKCLTTGSGCGYGIYSCTEGL